VSPVFKFKTCSALNVVSVKILLSPQIGETGGTPFIEKPKRQSADVVMFETVISTSKR
jgi:hypothetical protein